MNNKYSLFDKTNALMEILPLINPLLKDIDNFMSQFFKYIDASDKSLEEVTSAFYYVISTGIHVNDSMEFVSRCEKFSIGHNADFLSEVKDALLIGNSYKYGSH